MCDLDYYLIFLTPYIAPAINPITTIEDIGAGVVSSTVSSKPGNCANPVLVIINRLKTSITFFIFCLPVFIIFWF